MGKALGLRDDYDASSLRLLARKAKDARVARRLLALACIYDGMDRSAAAKAGGMDRQSLRDWVSAFNAKGPDGLCDGKRSGAPSKLNAADQAKLKEIVLAGPDLEVDHVVRWRFLDLQVVIKREFDITVSEVTVGRLLRRLGFAHVSANGTKSGLTRVHFGWVRSSTTSVQTARVIRCQSNMPAVQSCCVCGREVGTALLCRPT